MRANLFFYRAVIRSVYDGDTCHADIDLGLSIWMHNEKLRLARINAPELRGAEHTAGLASRDYLRTLIDGKEVILETIKDRKGKYGRYLAEIWLKQKDDSYLNVNDRLVEKGFAVYVTY